jgi:hypothetical protein
LQGEGCDIDNLVFLFPIFSIRKWKLIVFIDHIIQDSRLKYQLLHL